MVKKLLSIVGLAIVASLTITTTAFGQTGAYPFPQNIDYTYGLKPDNANDADVQAAYDYWKTNFVTSTDACGDRRVIFDYFPGTQRGREDRKRTVSEGIAYGMLITAYMDDKPLFDDLWDYYKRFRNQNGVMHYRIDACSVSGPNGATDAELDVAMALIVASYQWQSDSYLNDAKNMIRIIRQHEVEAGSLVLKPGDAFGGSNITCPSYFSPAYYRVFEDIDDGKPYAGYWLDVADKGYDIIDLASGTTGLVPDWCNASGQNTSDPLFGNYEDNGRNFIFDAIRTPFRSAVDFLWHGDPRAKAYCEKLSNWLISQGSPTQIGSKYGTAVNGNEGQKLNNDHNNTFVGCFGVGVMGTELTGQQTYMNQIYAENVNVNPNFGEYFNASFKVLSLLVMTGNFYLPPPDQCDSPELGDDRSLCEGSPLTLDATVTNRTYVWRRNGSQIPGSSRTLDVTQAGIYEVIATDPSGCVRRDKVEVFSAPLDPDFQATPAAGSVFITNTSTGGVSDYSWSLVDSDNTITPVTSSEENPVFDDLASGSYDITLTISNDGFGCTGISDETITKTIIVGDGAGLAIDDFNGLDERLGVSHYVYGPDGDEFDPLPRTFCSRNDELNPDLSNPDCDAGRCCFDHRCSYIDLQANGSTENWASLEFAFDALDLDGAAFLSVKMSASSPVTVAWRLGSGEVTDYLSDVLTADVTTEEQIFNFNFNDVLSGDVNGTAETITDWSQVIKIVLRPYIDDLTFDGTISIDWIILGSKSLPPPAIDVRKDEFGYTDFSNYLPDYYPNDPTYDGCTEEDDTGLCYGAVPDWEREVDLCEGDDVELVMNACTADQINWYKQGALVGSGDTYTANSSGKYLVELINQGGITYDSVTVNVSETPEVDFITSIEDDGYGLRVVPSFTNTDDWEWDFGILDSEMSEGPEAKAWEESYNNYSEDNGGPGEGTYDVCLTAINTECSLDETICKEVEIICSAPLGDFDLSSSPEAIVESGDVDTIYTCNDTELTVSTTEVTNAGSYGWFGQSAYTSDINELVNTFTDSELLKVEAYNACGEKVVDSVYVKVEEEVVASIITSDETGTNTYDFEAEYAGYSAVYTWDFGDGSPVVTGGIDEIYVTHTFPDAGEYTVTLSVSNDCGGPLEDQVSVGCETPDVSGATITGTEVLCDGDGCQTYTLTGVTGATPTGYTWTVPTGAASCSETDDEIEIDFDGTAGGTIEVTADIACGASETVELAVTVNAAPAISAATATPNPVCEGEDVELSVTGPASATYTWSGPDAYSAGTQTATVPNVTGGDAGTFSVTATENGCTSVAEEVDLIVNALPEQAVPSATPDVACEGEDIQLAASDVTGATYNWTGPNGFTSGVQNPLLSALTDADEGVYSVTTTVGSCTSLPVDVSIQVRPVAALSGITGARTVECASTETYSVDPVTAGSDYVWTLPNNSTQIGATTDIAWGANGGTLSVTETTAGGCTATRDVTISVNTCPFPTPDFTADATSGCGTLTVNFTDESATVDAGLDTYAWDFGDGSPIDNTEGDVSHTYASTGTFTVTLTITDDADGKTYTKTSTINVYEVPTLSNITPDFEICAGDAIDLSVTTDLGTVTWTGPSGYTDNGEDISVTANAVTGNSGPYTAIATSNGCDSDPLTVDVTVNAAATVASISGSIAVDCGTTETYTVLPSANGTSSYEWTLPNGTTQSDAPTDITWDETEGTLTVVETTADGCTGQATATISITPCPNPTPNFEASSESGCAPLAVQFSDLSSAVGAGDSYEWNFGDGSPVDNTVGATSHTYTAGGTYTVTLTITDISAGNATFTETKTSYITVASSDVDATEPTISGNDQVCINEAGVTYSISPVTGADTYTWTVPTGATIVSGQGGTTITVDFGSTSGDVTVLPESTCGGTGTEATYPVSVGSVLPTVDINSDGAICIGVEVTFSADYTNEGTDPELYWSVNGVENPTPTFTYTTSSLVAGDELSVRYVSNNACASPGTATDLITISEGSAEVSDITGTNLITDCPATGLEVYSVDPVSDPDAYFDWYVEGGVITDATGTPITGNDLGFLTNEIYVDFSGTTAKSIATVSLYVDLPSCRSLVPVNPIQVSLCTPTSITGQLDGTELDVYPNPFAETSNIKVTSETENEFEIVIYNAVSGLTVYEGAHSTNDVIEVGQDWTSGLYIGQAIFDGGVLTFKIEKAR